MSDLVFRVLLKADGSGLIGQTRLSREETAKLKSSLEQAAGGAEKLAASTGKAGRAANDHAKDLRQEAASADQAAASQNRLSDAAKKAEAAQKAAAKAAAQQRQATQQLGVQINDFATQVSAGINPLVAFNQQAGQVGFVMSQMEGKAGAVGRFLAGPWGGLIVIATSVLGSFAAQFLASEEATGEAEKALEKFAERQADIGKFIDATTGRLIEQNRTLIQNAILLRQSQIDKNNVALKEQRQGVSRAIDSVAIIGSTFRAERQAGAPTFDPAILAIVKQANGDIEKLDIGLQALARRRPDLKDTVQIVSDAAAQAVLLSRENKRLGTEIDQLSGKTVGQTKVTADLIEKQVALATATTPLEKARAKLALVTVDGTAAEKAGGQALQKYRADLMAAREAVNAAEAAERGVTTARRAHNKELRDSAREAREAAKAQVELQRSLEGLERRFDPAAAAARAYRDALSDISELASAGKITDDQASQFGKAALDEFYKADAAAFSKRMEELKTKLSPALQEAFDRPLVDVADTLEKALYDAGLAGGEGLRRAGLDAAREIARQLGVSLGSNSEGLFGGLIDSTQFQIGKDEVAAKQKELIDKLGSIFNPSGGEFVKGLSKELGKASAGAQTGSQIAGIGKSIWGKFSTTGSEIGGSIGALTGLPGGDIIGSIIGGTIGGLLKKTKKASATLSLGDDGLTSTVTGNSKSRRVASTAAADSVIGALQSIADQFGGSITGDPSVSIGVRKKSFRVDPTGQGKTKIKSGAVDFGDDQAGAIAFATADAIKDGVITGLSPAIKKALQSSDDLDKAVREALKIDDLETLLSGIAGQLGKVFKDFERQAAERTRIAAKYGFDLVKLEEVTGKERAALFEKALGDRIGSLQTLLSDLTIGDLFEGSAADQRAKLLIERAKAQGDAEAGIEGAADKLADLNRRLIELSREAFGTAGSEFASDRASAVSGIERVVQLENERARAAQEEARKLTAAAEKTATLTDETNNLLAETNARLVALPAEIAKLLPKFEGLDLSNVARSTPLR